MVGGRVARSLPRVSKSCCIVFVVVAVMQSVVFKNVLVSEPVVV